MAYNGVIYAGTLANINLAAASSLAVLSPLLTQLDFSLFGAVGLGAIQSNFKSQLSSSQKASVDIGLNLVNPFNGFQLALSAVGTLLAQISVALSGAVPLVSIEATTQLSATLAMQAQLSAQIGAIDVAIQSGLSAKAPAVNLATELSTALSAGPVFILSWDGVPLSDAAASISGSLSSGVTFGVNSIGPSETVYGILLLTKSVTAWSAMQSTMKVS